MLDGPMKRGRVLYLEIVVEDEEEAKEILSMVSLGRSEHGCKFTRVWFANPVRLFADDINKLLNKLLSEYTGDPVA